MDLVTFTSSSTVRNFLAMLGSDAASLMGRTEIGCIGPITADTVREAGLAVAIQPEAYTVPALAEAIIARFAERRGEAGRAPARGTRRGQTAGDPKGAREKPRKRAKTDTRPGAKQRKKGGRKSAPKHAS